jgi:hypothetical protein
MLNIFRNIEYKKGWISYEITQYKKEQFKPYLKYHLNHIVRNITTPSVTSIATIVIVLLISWVIQWALNKDIWWPLTNYLMLPKRQVALSGIWQVQIALSVAALPILIFIIELTKDERLAATKSSEVLIRETLIFPIILLCFFIAFKIGLDIFFSKNSKATLIVNLVLFSLSIILTIYAYYKALNIMFSPSILHNKSIKLMKEKMKDSVIQSAEIRVGNNILFKKFREIGIDYQPFSLDRLEKEQFYIIASSKFGRIIDVNIDYIKNIFDSLQLKSFTQADGFSQEDFIDKNIISTLTNGQFNKKIFFKKQYMDFVTQDYPELFTINKKMLTENLDLIEIQKSILKGFKLEENDEN